jgi:hypothetical protein
MKKLKLALILLLPSFLCIVINFIFVDEGLLLIGLFSLILSICNLNKTKFDFTKSIVFTLIASFVVFGVAILNYIIVGFILENLTALSFFNFSISGIDLNYLLQVAFFSPLFLFYGYKYIFKISFTYISFLIIFITILLLIILGIAQLKHGNKYYFGILEFWQIIIAFAIQLILYQEDIKALFKSKKG